MECHSLGLKRERSINVPLEDSLKTSERVVKLIDVVQLLIELATACFIHFLEELSVTIASFSSSISPWTSLWRVTNAEVLWLITWLMVQFIE